MKRIGLLAAALVFVASNAHGDKIETRLVAAPRITVADVVPNAPISARDVDLGASPAPGASRLVSKDEIVRTLFRSGISSSFSIANSTRVMRKKEHFTGRALADLSRSAIMPELPAGITIAHVDQPVDLDAPEGTQISKVTLPRFPKQKGPFRTSVKVSLTAGDEHVVDLTIGVTVDISELAAQHDVKKGTRVMVIVERESLRVSVEGVLARDSDIGDLTQVSIVSTGHPLRVKLLSKTTTELAEDR